MAKYSYHRLDRNHDEISEALLNVGASVSETGPLDLIVGFRGLNYLLEVKTKNGKLRPSQERFFSTWAGQRALVRSVDDALRVIGAIV